MWNLPPGDSVLHVLSFVALTAPPYYYDYYGRPYNAPPPYYAPGYYAPPPGYYGR